MIVLHTRKGNYENIKFVDVQVLMAHCMITSMARKTWMKNVCVLLAQLQSEFVKIT